MERGAKERGATARATMVGVDPIARDDVAADDCGYSTPTSTDSVKGRGVSMAREWPRPAWGESRDGGACVTPLKFLDRGGAHLSTGISPSAHEPVRIAPMAVPPGDRDGTGPLGCGMDTTRTTTALGSSMTSFSMDFGRISSRKFHHHHEQQQAMMRHDHNESINSLTPGKSHFLGRPQVKEGPHNNNGTCKLGQSSTSGISPPVNGRGNNETAHLGQHSRRRGDPEGEEHSRVSCVSETSRGGGRGDKTTEYVLARPDVPVRRNQDMSNRGKDKCSAESENSTAVHPVPVGNLHSCHDAQQDHGAEQGCRDDGGVVASRGDEHLQWRQDMVKQVAAQLATLQDVGKEAGVELGDEWKEARTSNGQIYYYNRRTRVSRWSLPPSALYLPDESRPSGYRIFTLMTDASPRPNDTSGHSQTGRNGGKSFGCGGDGWLVDGDRYFARRGEGVRARGDVSKAQSGDDRDIVGHDKMVTGNVADEDQRVQKERAVQRCRAPKEDEGKQEAMVPEKHTVEVDKTRQERIPPERDSCRAVAQDGVDHDRVPQECTIEGGVLLKEEHMVEPGREGGQRQSGQPPPPASSEASSMWLSRVSRMTSALDASWSSSSLRREELADRIEVDDDDDDNVDDDSDDESEPVYPQTTEEASSFFVRKAVPKSFNEGGDDKNAIFAKNDRGNSSDKVVFSASLSAGSDNSSDGNRNSGVHESAAASMMTVDVGTGTRVDTCGAKVADHHAESDTTRTVAGTNFVGSASLAAPVQEDTVVSDENAASVTGTANTIDVDVSAATDEVNGDGVEAGPPLVEVAFGGSGSQMASAQKDATLFNKTAEMTSRRESSPDGRGKDTAPASSDDGGEERLLVTNDKAVAASARNTPVLHEDPPVTVSRLSIGESIHGRSNSNEDTPLVADEPAQTGSSCSGGDEAPAAEQSHTPPPQRRKGYQTSSWLSPSWSSTSPSLDLSPRPTGGTNVDVSLRVSAAATAERTSSCRGGGGAVGAREWDESPLPSVPSDTYPSDDVGSSSCTTSSTVDRGGPGHLMPAMPTEDVEDRGAGGGAMAAVAAIPTRNCGVLDTCDAPQVESHPRQSAARKSGLRESGGSVALVTPPSSTAKGAPPSLKGSNTARGDGGGTNPLTTPSKVARARIKVTPRMGKTSQAITPPANSSGNTSANLRLAAETSPLPTVAAAAPMVTTSAPPTAAKTRTVGAHYSVDLSKDAVLYDAEAKQAEEEEAFLWSARTGRRRPLGPVLRSDEYQVGLQAPSELSHHDGHAVTPAAPKTPSTALAGLQSSSSSARVRAGEQGQNTVRLAAGESTDELPGPSAVRHKVRRQLFSEDAQAKPLVFCPFCGDGMLKSGGLRGHLERCYVLSRCRGGAMHEEVLNALQVLSFSKTVDHASRDLQDNGVAPGSTTPIVGRGEKLESQGHFTPTVILTAAGAVEERSSILDVSTSSTAIAAERSAENSGENSLQEFEQCGDCGRTFAPGRLQAHSKACRSVFMERRTPYDLRAMRARGTPLEFFQKPLDQPAMGREYESPAPRAAVAASERRRTNSYGRPKRNRGSSDRSDVRPSRNMLGSRWPMDGVKQEDQPGDVSYAGEETTGACTVSTVAATPARGYEGEESSNHNHEDDVNNNTISGISIISEQFSLSGREGFPLEEEGRGGNIPKQVTPAGTKGFPLDEQGDGEQAGAGGGVTAAAAAAVVVGSNRYGRDKHDVEKRRSDNGSMRAYVSNKSRRGRRGKAGGGGTVLGTTQCMFCACDIPRSKYSAHMLRCKSLRKTRTDRSTRKPAAHSTDGIAASSATAWRGPSSGMMNRIATGERVRCPHCMRQFSQTAGPVHIAICARVEHRPDAPRAVSASKGAGAVIQPPFY